MYSIDDHQDAEITAKQLPVSSAGMTDGYAPKCMHIAYKRPHMKTPSNSQRVEARDLINEPVPLNGDIAHQRGFALSRNPYVEATAKNAEWKNDWLLRHAHVQPGASDAEGGSLRPSETLDSYDRYIAAQAKDINDLPETQRLDRIHEFLRDIFTLADFHVDEEGENSLAEASHD
jgi:hypothetical protein